MDDLIDAAPEQAAGPGQPPAPAPRLRQTYDYLMREKVPGVTEHLPATYEEFEAGMSEPDNIKALHGLFKDQKWEGADLEEPAFGAFVLEGTAKKKAPSEPSSPPAGTGSLPAGDVAFQAVADQPAQPLAEPAAPLAGAPMFDPAARATAADMAQQGYSLPVPAPGIQQVPGDDYLAAGLPLPSGEQLRAEREALDQTNAAEAQAASGDGFWHTLGKSLYNNLGKPGLTRLLGNVIEQGGDMAEYLTSPFPNGMLARDDKATDQIGRDFRAVAENQRVAQHPDSYRSILDAPTSPQAWAGLVGQGVSSIALVGVGGALGGPGGAAAAGGALSVDQTRETARAAHIPESEAMLTATVMAPVMGGLEALGMGFITKNPVAMRLLKTELATRALAYGEGKLSQSALARATSELLPEVVKKYGGRAVTSGLGEGGTEWLQESAQAEGEVLADKMRGNEQAPAGQGRYGTTQADVARRGGQGFAGGLVMGSGFGALHGEHAMLPEAPAVDAAGQVVPLGESPTRGPLYAEFGPDRKTVRYLNGQGQEVDFGPQGPPPAVHQAVGAARATQLPPTSLPPTSPADVPAQPAPTPPAAPVPQPGQAPVLVMKDGRPLFADYDAATGEPTALYSAEGETFSLADPAVRERVQAARPVPESAPSVPETAQNVPETSQNVPNPPESVPETTADETSLPPREALTSQLTPTASAPEPAPAYGTPAENRQAGRFEKDGQTYERPAPLGEKLVRGTEAVAHFAHNVAQPVQYAVLEAADVQPSHTGGSPNLRHFLPEAQPKNRSAAFDPASQKAIADIAAAPDLGQLSESPNAYSGSPLVNSRGEVLQGNGRAEGIRQHYRQGGASYRAEVTAAAEKVGIPAAQLAGLREPVLVRVADVSDQRARELGNYGAADLESGGQRRLDARQAAGRLDEDGRAALTRLTQPQGEATLTETIRGNAAELLRLLRQQGLVNATQLQTMTKPDGTLTPQGVEDLAALHRHGLFAGGDPNLPELFAELPAPAQGGLDRAVGALLGVPEQASLLPDVHNAIGGVREFQASGADFATWAGQADLFRGGEAPRTRYTPLTLKLVELLATEKRPTYIARLFTEYAAAVKGQAASLFSETPPIPRTEAVEQVFGVKDEPAAADPRSGIPRAEEGAPGPVAADERPPAPGLPAAPGAGAAAEPAAEPAAASNRATRAGAEAAAAEPASQQRDPVTVTVGKTDYVVSSDAAGKALVTNQLTGKVLGERSVQYGQARRAAEKVRAESAPVAGADELRASGPKFYADLVDAPSVLAQAGRIQPDPIRGEQPKAQDKIVLDLRRASGITVFFSKRPGGAKGSRALGSYNPRNAAVAIKASADLDVTAHELGHALDDRFELLPKASAAALAEIAPLARFGSQPPAGHPDPQHYRHGEALAEFVRAYLVNPDATRAAYPEFTRHYEQAIPAKMRAAVESFGRDLRVFAGASAHDQVMSNVRMKPEAPGGIMGVLKPATTGKTFQLTFGDRVQATMLNALHPFEKAMNYAREVGGLGELLPEQNPNVLARLFLGLNDKMDNLMRRGLVDSRNERVLDEVTQQPMNLAWLLDPLDKTTAGTIEAEQAQVVSYMVAQRTVELSQRFGREAALSGIGGGLFTDVAVAEARVAEVAALAASNPAQHTRLVEAGRRYQAYADQNLRYLVERGRLSQAQYDAIKENNAQYVAMQRVMEAEPGAEIQVFGGGPGGRSFTAAKQPLQKVQGSGRSIKNPYSALLDATYAATREADRNAIMQAVRELFAGPERGMNQGQLQELGALARPAAEGDPHTVKVFVDGQAEHWQLDADVFRAISELANSPLDGPLAQVLKAPSTLLRWSVTHSPVFALRNVIRDTRGRLITSTSTPETGFDVLTNAGVRQQSRDGLDLAGGGQAGHYLRDETAYYDTMQQQMRRLAKDKRFVLADPAKLAKGAWQGYTAALGQSETIGRLMEYRSAYKQAKAKGLDDYNASLYAAYEARDLMDFAVAGTFMREVNKYVPFTNAAVQGLRRAAKSATQNPGGMAGRWLLYSVVPTLLVRGLIHRLGRDDDYAQLPAYQRDGFDNLPLPGGKWLVIPRPFELGTLAASADRFLSQQAAGDPHAWEGYGSSLSKSFIPADESAVAGGLKPVVEVLTNHDFFKGQSIISPNEEKLSLNLRHTERGSRLGQWVGKAVGMDSRNVDHLISGTSSYYGNWLMKASNWGRQDGQTFSVADTGFIKDQPVTQARDVQWLQQRLEDAGLGQSKPARALAKLLQRYHAQKTDEDRRKVGEKATRLAVKLRTLLDEEKLQRIGAARQARREQHRR